MVQTVQSQSVQLMLETDFNHADKWNKKIEVEEQSPLWEPNPRLRMPQTDVVVVCP